jgi:hypothetical protein
VRENLHSRWRSSVGGTDLIAPIVGGLVLLALIAVASRARMDGGGGVGSTAAGIATIVLLAILCTAVGVAGLSITGYALVRDTRLRTKLALLAGVLLIAPAAVALVLYESTETNRPAYGQWCQDGTVHMRRQQWATNRRWGDRLYGGRAIDTGRPCRDDGGGGGARVANRGGAGGGGEANLLVATVGGTLLAILIGAVVLAVVMRRLRVVGAADAGEDVVLQAVDESLDDLRRERDVRRAIIACYARMERAFERSGSPRRPHEAPFEFLARVLEGVAREPGLVLTELFERAKYSVEPMEETDKERAISALEQLRTELASRAPEEQFRSPDL